jgi:hypothetical protein
MAWAITAGIGIATGVIGTGVSIYGQVQQGRAADAAAQWNAFNSEQEAQQQLWLSGLQSKMAEREAQYRAQIAQAEAGISYANAGAAVEEVKAKVLQAQENIRRGREEGQTMLAAQDVSFAGAGIVSTTGTPLKVMADTMQQIESQATDEAYKANVERQTGLFEAKVLRYQGDVQSAGGQAEFNISRMSNRLNAITAQINYRNGMRGASIERMAGISARRNATLGAIGTGLSGLGTAAMQTRAAFKP